MVNDDGLGGITHAFRVEEKADKSAPLSLNGIKFDIGVSQNIIFFVASLNLKLFYEELLLFMREVGLIVDLFLSLFNVKEKFIF